MTAGSIDHSGSSSSIGEAVAALGAVRRAARARRPVPDEAIRFPTRDQVAHDPVGFARIDIVGTHKVEAAPQRWSHLV